MEVDIDVEGFAATRAAVDALPGLMAENIQGDGLAAAARIARDAAREADYGFVDRSGRLRDSIRVRRISTSVKTTRGTRKVRGGGARLYAGGTGAKQALLVERGHGGPRPARPHPYVVAAITATIVPAFAAAAASMQKSFGRLQTRIATGRVTQAASRLLGGPSRIT